MTTNTVLYNNPIKKTHIDASINSLQQSIIELEQNLTAYTESINSAKSTLAFYEEKYRRCESSIAETKNALKVLEILKDGRTKGDK